MNKKIYEIDFNGHLKTKIEVENNKIKILASMNGWGNGISNDEIIIKESE